MNALIFDTGPLITIATNNLLWILEPLRKCFKGEFIIPEGVKFELIDRPLQGKRFKFEAMQALKLVGDKTLTIVSGKEIDQLTDDILALANNSYSAHGNWIQIMHRGEAQVITTALLYNSPTIVIDERTTRDLIEYPIQIQKTLQRKLHTKITTDAKNQRELQDKIKHLNVLRSTEIVTVAYEMGLLDKYLFEGEKKFLKNPKQTLLEALLWGMKLRGCSISEQEIATIQKIAN